MSLESRLAALSDAAELGAGRISDEQDAAIRRVLAAARARRSLSAEHTVVGFFGATGSGKSSLFNAVVGAELARAHVRRPTTSQPLAAVWNPEGADALLDWLEVHDRRHPDAAFAGDAALSLVLLDLPDFDSVEAEHRQVAERLAGQVDVLVWVTDPQKYADAVMHRDFVQRFGAHASVTAAVLNQIDTLGAGDVQRVTQSLEGLLRRDGLSDAVVIPASAATGDGVNAVRGMIARFARERRALTSRLEADVTSIASALGAGSEPTAVPKAAEAELTRRLTAAAGVPLVSNAVAASVRKRTGQATGWPLVSWMLRLRPDPLRRLHLGERRGDSDLHRTSLPPMSSAQRAQAGSAVRGYADAAADGVPEPWQAGIREAAYEATEALPAALDRAIARTDLGAQRAWWWPVFSILQVLSLLTALVGIGWLVAAALLPVWGLPRLDIPVAEGWPVPTLLVAGGVLLGIVLGILGGLLGLADASARRARAKRRLTRQVEAAAQESVIAPIMHERDRAAAYFDAVRRALGTSMRSR